MIERKTVVLLAGLLFLVGGVAADVPELVVEPGNVTGNVSSGDRHEYVFTVRNNDSDNSVQNVTLQDSRNVNWTPNQFDLNKSSSREVTASVRRGFKGRVDQSFRPEYWYSGADNSFLGPEIGVNVSVYNKGTRVKPKVLEDSFKLELGETGSSVFQLSNTGGAKAFNVSISSTGNISFNRGNGFELPANETRIVLYNVTVPEPAVNKTEATNQSYSFDVEISGQNFGSENFTVSVFVPFKEYDTIERQRDVIEELRQLQQFCEKQSNRDLPICGAKVVENNTKIKYVNRTPQANVTLTGPELQSLKQIANTTDLGFSQLVHRVRLQQNTIRSQENRTRGVVKQGVEKIENKTEENQDAISSLNRSVVTMIREDRQEDSNQKMWSWITRGVVLLFLLGFTTIKTIEYLDNRSTDTRI